MTGTTNALPSMDPMGNVGIRNELEVDFKLKGMMVWYAYAKIVESLLLH